MNKSLCIYVKIDPDRCKDFETVKKDAKYIAELIEKITPYHGHISYSLLKRNQDTVVIHCHDNGKKWLVPLCDVAKYAEMILHKKGYFLIDTEILGE